MSTPLSSTKPFDGTLALVKAYAFKPEFPWFTIATMLFVLGNGLI